LIGPFSARNGHPAELVRRAVKAARFRQSSSRSTSFIVDGATPAKNSALTSAGAELRFANGVTLLAKFDGEFASHSSTYAGTGTARYTW